eukprot:16387-Heterococcus_DN1.PRE.2
MAADCVGPRVNSMVSSLADGEAMLLENVRFYKEETANDAAFAKDLSAPFDMFVNDAFGSAHRAHCSTEGVSKYLSPSVAGFLLQKELTYLQHNTLFVLALGDASVALSVSCMCSSCGMHSPSASCTPHHWCAIQGAVTEPKRPFAAIVGGSKVSSKIGVIELNQSSKRWTLYPKQFTYCCDTHGLLMPTEYTS